MRRALPWVLASCAALLGPSCGKGDDAQRAPRTDVPPSGLAGIWTLDGPGSADSLREFLASTARQAALEARTRPADGTAAGEVTAADVEARTRQLMETVKHLEATLEFRADRTWTARGQMGLWNSDQTSSGTWVEKDGGIVATPDREGDLRAAGKSARPMVLRRQGSKLVFEVPGAPPGTGILFERR